MFARHLQDIAIQHSGTLNIVQYHVIFKNIKFWN